jgi:hypothetical protein
MNTIFSNNGIFSFWNKNESKMLFDKSILHIKYSKYFSRLHFVELFVKCNVLDDYVIMRNKYMLGITNKYEQSAKIIVPNADKCHNDHSNNHSNSYNIINDKLT